MAQALFYPWIDILNEAWLKTSLLYWDSVRTIVPEAIDEPYLSDTGRILQAAGFLIPLRVHLGMSEIEDLTEDTLAYLGTAEETELLLGNRGYKHYIHFGKLPLRLRWFENLHPDKLPIRLHDLLRRSLSTSERGSDWLQVDRGFADFYMTLLASRLAERIGAQLVTDLPIADRLAVAVRLDAQLNGMVPRCIGGPWQEYEAYGRRHWMPRRLASGMLASLAIERIGIAPDTPVERLMEFRERHHDELGLFRKKIAELASSADSDLPLEALRQRVLDIYTGEVTPALSNLKKALRSQGIRSISEGILKIAFLSAGSSSMLVAAGLSVHTALLAGAGLSLIVSGTLYNADRRQSLQENPFAYLLSIERNIT